MISLLRKSPSARLARVLLMGLATLIRVIVVVVLSSLIWVPIGIYIGLRPGLCPRGSAR